MHHSFSARFAVLILNTDTMNMVSRGCSLGLESSSTTSSSEVKIGVRSGKTSLPYQNDQKVSTVPNYTIQQQQSPSPPPNTRHRSDRPSGAPRVHPSVLPSAPPNSSQSSSPPVSIPYVSPPIYRPSPVAQMRAVVSPSPSGGSSRLVSPPSSSQAAPSLSSSLPNQLPSSRPKKERGPSYDVLMSHKVPGDIHGLSTFLHSARMNGVDQNSQAYVELAKVYSKVTQEGQSWSAVWTTEYHKALFDQVKRSIRGW